MLNQNYYFLNADTLLPYYELHQLLCIVIY